jgi:Predicted ribosomal protein
MIIISINKNAEGICNGFRVEGHAGYADEGQDIVCAAVSVLVINTINSIEQFTKDRFHLETKEETGYIELKMISSISNDTKLLLNSLILGLQGIEENYGNEYLKMNE